jgi:hypothetical protein
LDPEKKKRLLVERIETLVSSETSKYFILHKPGKEKASGSGGDSAADTTSGSSIKSRYQ